MTEEEFSPTERTWAAKFRDAWVGIALGVRGQSSFRAHLACAALVVALAAALRLDRLEWCFLVLCITAVLTAELFNSALERLAKAIDRRQNPHLGAALDIASGAVLVTALGAALVGAAIFLPHLASLLLRWWTP